MSLEKFFAIFFVLVFFLSCGERSYLTSAEEVPTPICPCSSFAAVLQTRTDGSKFMLLRCAECSIEECRSCFTSIDISCQNGSEEL